MRDGTGYDDPVGGPQVQEVKLFTGAATIDDIGKLGKIEYAKLKSLPVPAVTFPAPTRVTTKRVPKVWFVNYSWWEAGAPPNASRLSASSTAPVRHRRYPGRGSDWGVVVQDTQGELPIGELWDKIPRETEELPIGEFWYKIPRARAILYIYIYIYRVAPVASHPEARRSPTGRGDWAR